MKKELEVTTVEQWGTAEQMPNSRYQVMLTDKRNKSLSPLNQPKINRFFEKLEERDGFINSFKIELTQQGGSLKHNPRLNHPSFVVFQIYNQNGENDFDITVYM